MPPPPPQLEARLQGAFAAVATAGIDALVVSSTSNLAYLSGLRTSAGVVLVARDHATLVVDGRYSAEAASATAALGPISLVVVAPGRSYEEVVAERVLGQGWSRVGFEAGALTLERLAALRRALGDHGAPELVETAMAIEALRAVKDPWELGILREAGARLSAVAACILPKVSAGQTERQVAWAIDVALHSAGFERPAFETIVASGPHAARPHHRPTARRLEAGDLVLLDFGGVLDGYVVDMSRTVGLGRLDSDRQSWLDAVHAAQAAAIAEVAPGRQPSAIDGAARGVLARAGLADYFVHSTGHGLGLDVHEGPTIGPRGDLTGPLQPGMVFTIEPGVYVADRGGVRIEDDVLVTRTGVERLTS